MAYVLDAGRHFRPDAIALCVTLSAIGDAYNHPLKSIAYNFGFKQHTQDVSLIRDRQAVRRAAQEHLRPSKPLIKRGVAHMARLLVLLLESSRLRRRREITAPDIND